MKILMILGTGAIVYRFRWTRVLYPTVLVRVIASCRKSARIRTQETGIRAGI